MTCNMGSTDRIIRGVIGIGVLGAGYYFQSLWGLVGLIPLVTALIGWCPAYVPFGISTTSKE
ncbi:MAG: YgaP family membrane protein [Gemmatimonadota bacterium]